MPLIVIRRASSLYRQHAQKCSGLFELWALIPLFRNECRRGPACEGENISIRALVIVCVGNFNAGLDPAGTDACDFHFSARGTARR